MLLTDRARKVLAIVWHTYGHAQADYVKGIPLLCQRSRLSEGDARDALNELVSTGYSSSSMCFLNFGIKLKFVINRIF